MRTHTKHILECNMRYTYIRALHAHNLHRPTNIISQVYSFTWTFTMLVFITSGVLDLSSHDVIRTYKLSLLLKSRESSCDLRQSDTRTFAVKYWKFWGVFSIQESDRGLQIMGHYSLKIENPSNKATLTKPWEFTVNIHAWNLSQAWTNIA